jgi:hypothetical protein
MRSKNGLVRDENLQRDDGQPNAEVHRDRDQLIDRGAP